MKISEWLNFSPPAAAAAQPSSRPAPQLSALVGGAGAGPRTTSTSTQGIRILPAIASSGQSRGRREGHVIFSVCCLGRLGALGRGRWGIREGGGAARLTSSPFLDSGHRAA